jgi:hypothetical protein
MRLRNKNIARSSSVRAGLACASMFLAEVTSSQRLTYRPTKGFVETLKQKLRQRGSTGSHFWACSLHVPLMMPFDLGLRARHIEMLKTGPDSKIQKPLAAVVMGWIVSSNLVTLFILSMLYKVFEREPVRDTTIQL